MRGSTQMVPAARHDSPRSFDRGRTVSVRRKACRRTIAARRSPARGSRRGGRAHRFRQQRAKAAGRHHRGDRFGRPVAIDEVGLQRVRSCREHRRRCGRVDLSGGRSEDYRRGFAMLFPPDQHARVFDALDATGLVLRHWLAGQFATMTLVGVLSGLVYWWIGLPSPVALGAIAGVTNFVPFVGPFLSAIPPLLLALSINGETVAWTLAAVIVIQQFEGNIATPLIQRRAVCPCRRPWASSRWWCLASCSASSEFSLRCRSPRPFRFSCASSGFGRRCTPTRGARKDLSGWAQTCCFTNTP